jgi:hypothetical protein
LPNSNRPTGRMEVIGTKGDISSVEQEKGLELADLFE